MSLETADKTNSRSDQKSIAFHSPHSNYSYNVFIIPKK